MPHRAFASRLCELTCSLLSQWRRDPCRSGQAGATVISSMPSQSSRNFKYRRSQIGDRRNHFERRFRYSCWAKDDRCPHARIGKRHISQSSERSAVEVPASAAVVVAFSNADAEFSDHESRWVTMISVEASSEYDAQAWSHSKRSRCWIPAGRSRRECYPQQADRVPRFGGIEAHARDLDIVAICLLARRRRTVIASFSAAGFQQSRLNFLDSSGRRPGSERTTDLQLPAILAAGQKLPGPSAMSDRRCADDRTQRRWTLVGHRVMVGSARECRLRRRKR